jgi:hypothetical protein
MGVLDHLEKCSDMTSSNQANQAAILLFRQQLLSTLVRKAGNANIISMPTRPWDIKSPNNGGLWRKQDDGPVTNNK